MNSLEETESERIAVRMHAERWAEADDCTAGVARDAN